MISDENSCGGEIFGEACAQQSDLLVLGEVISSDNSTAERFLILLHGGKNKVCASFPLCFGLKCMLSLIMFMNLLNECMNIDYRS